MSLDPTLQQEKELPTHSGLDGFREGVRNEMSYEYGDTADELVDDVRDMSKLWKKYTDTCDDIKQIGESYSLSAKVRNLREEMDSLTSKYL